MSSETESAIRKQARRRLKRSAALAARKLPSAPDLDTP